VFVPELNETLVGPLMEAIEETAGRWRAFDAALDPPRVVRAGGRPRLVCADLANGAEQVLRLTAALSAVLDADRARPATIPITARHARAFPQALDPRRRRSRVEITLGW